MKKKPLKLIALLLALILGTSITVMAVAYFEYTSTYDDVMAGDGKVFAKGVEVSSVLGDDIDFSEIKNAGYDYVIIRCGTSDTKDTCFENFYSAAKDADLNVGLYFTSYATTVAEAQADATYCKSWIEGKTFEYPVYYNYEYIEQAGISQDTTAGICKAFLSAMQEADYLAGLYAFENVLTQDWITTSEIRENYDGWVINYLESGNPKDKFNDYKNKYGMFQYTDSVEIGSKCFCASVSYKNYPRIASTYGMNGYSATTITDGALDIVSGDVGCVEVFGWACDGNDKSKAVKVNIYIGGDENSSTADKHTITADQERVDVNQHLAFGNNHGYHAILPTAITGEQTVYAYAVKHDGTTQLLGSKVATITKDTVKPTISEIELVSSDRNGYTVQCYVSDNVDIQTVYFPTWTATQEASQAIWYKASLENGVATCTIPIADFNNYQGVYNTHAYIKDLAGNEAPRQQFSTTFHLPKGSFDTAQDYKGAVRVRGWAFDADDLDAGVTVHLYVGGEAGAGITPVEVTANVSRPDVDSAYSCGSNHGFDVIIPTKLRGEQTIYAYAMNIKNGGSVYLGSKTVNITDDSQDPVITGQTVTKSNGVVTVKCNVSDNNMINKVELEIWNTDSSLSVKTAEMTVKNGVATFNINETDFETVTGAFVVQITAKDPADNATTVECTTAGEIRGDVNLDGVADIKDVTYMQKYLVGLNNMAQIQVRIGDVYTDSKITIRDATTLQLILAKLK